MDKQKITIDISWLTVVKVFLVPLILVFLYIIKDILALFFITVVIAASLSPIVDRWSKKMPRAIALLTILAILLAFIALIIWLMIPPLIAQITDLARSIGNWYPAFMSNFSYSEQVVKMMSDQLDRIGSTLSNGLFRTTTGIINGLVAFITALMLTFYILVDKNNMKNFLIDYLPIERKAQIVEVMRKIAHKMGSWVRGQLALMIIVGVANGLTMAILGLPYALTLGLWSGLMEVIPYIGPFLGLIPILIVAISNTDTFLIPLIVIAVFALVQQLEANVLVPKIMGKAVGLSPIIIIFAILVGGKLMGLTGIIIAVPVAAIISVIVKEWPKFKI